MTGTRQWPQLSGVYGDRSAATTWRRLAAFAYLASRSTAPSSARSSHDRPPWARENSWPDDFDLRVAAHEDTARRIGMALAERDQMSRFIRTHCVARLDLIDNVEPMAREALTRQVPDEVAGTYRSALPVRPGLVVTLVNIPSDLTTAEAERIASFVRMLALE